MKYVVVVTVAILLFAYIHFSQVAPASGSTLQAAASSNVSASKMNKLELNYSSLDQRCFHEMPRDGLCLDPYNSTGGCTLFFRRFSQQACEGFEASRGLCPCEHKRTVSVSNVRLAAVTVGDLIAAIFAFSHSDLGSWNLVDASSSEFSSLPCLFGDRVLKKKLSDIHSTFRLLARSNGSRGASMVQSINNSTPWSCSSYARPINYSNEVFYALDSSLNSPGHAADNIFFAVGHYFADGLNTRNVPWLVPCSDDWTFESAWTWSKFFVDVNQALNLPVFPLDIRLLNLTAVQPWRFQTVSFAPYYLGWNQGCRRQMTSEIFWPLVTKSNLASGVLAPLSICLMKVLFPNGTAMYSPERAFLFSLRFFKLLEENRVATLTSNLPLLQRMWHVNNAELIVTTWGSAMAIATSLLVAQGNRSHRLLVLIHPGYCLEASRLLRTRKKTCSTITARGPSRIFHRKLAVRDGAITDFIGGEGFCAKFLVVAGLRYVRQSDIEFRCT